MTGKNEIRAEILSKLRVMSAGERMEKSTKAIRNLEETAQFKGAGRIFCYASKSYEVQTQDLIRRMLGDGKEVYVPKTDKENRTLIVSQIMDFEKDLAAGAFGILEPSKTREADIKKIEMWIIPGIAFDRRGYRVGHGKGYFDSFFRKNSVRGMKLGMAYSFQIVPRVEEKTYDVPVDMVVTEREVINCKGER